MADEITIDSFSEEMRKILEDYGEDVQIIVNEEVVKIAKEAVTKVKKESPKNTGDYAKGWKMKKKEKRFGVETTVYNSTHGWLVHLLEHGHAKRNGGRDETQAKPHVKPVEKWAEKELINRVKEKL